MNLATDEACSGWCRGSRLIETAWRRISSSSAAAVPWKPSSAEFCVPWSAESCWVLAILVGQTGGVVSLQAVWWWTVGYMGLQLPLHDAAWLLSLYNPGRPGSWFPPQRFGQSLLSDKPVGKHRFLSMLTIIFSGFPLTSPVICGLLALYPMSCDIHLNHIPFLSHLVCIYIYTYVWFDPFWGGCSPMLPFKFISNPYNPICKPSKIISIRCNPFKAPPPQKKNNYMNPYKSTHSWVEIAMFSWLKHCCRGRQWGLVNTSDPGTTHAESGALAVLWVGLRVGLRSASNTLFSHVMSTLD